MLLSIHFGLFQLSHDESLLGIERLMDEFFYVGTTNERKRQIGMSIIGASFLRKVTKNTCLLVAMVSN